MSESINKIVRQLKADKKKLSLMICLMAFGMLLWGRFLLNKVPRTAVAEPMEALAVYVPLDTGVEVTPRKAVELTLYRTLTRNVFDLDATGYPRVVKVSADGQVLEKSKGKPVDETEHARSVRDAAGSLKLQSTMLGDRPRAVISGQVLYPGDKFRGFELNSVHPRHVVLEKEGVRVRLEM